MKKLAFALATVLSAASFGSINLNIDTQYQSVLLPGSGSVSVFFTGTVDVLLPTFDVNLAVLELPGDGTNFLGVAFDPAFVTYIAASAPGVDYAGGLFSVTVQSTDAPGFYWLNGSSSGMSELSELIVSASNGVQVGTDNEMYGVEVLVPEPASLAILGLGLAALARKKRKA